MERLLRHEGESRDTARLTWSHPRRLSGGQGAHREVGSERLEESHRVVINGSTSRAMNRSAKGGEWSSPHYGGEGTWVPLRRTKVFEPPDADRLYPEFLQICIRRRTQSGR